ncbi:hypothetical protein K1719_011016 [Acacia pycnantha]|nr:hypothetical protein K1719_011016 [Acacia pycnantha]
MEVGACSSGSRVPKQVVLSFDKKAEKFGGTLVGKILTGKKLNIPTVISMIRKGWKLEDDLEVHEMDGSQLTFLFRFHNVKDYGRILKGRPWSIQGFLLNLQVWEDHMVLKDVSFEKSPFWIQFHGVPLEAFDEQNAKILGDSVGETVMFENPMVGGRLERSFIRARVLVDLSESLSSGFWVPRVNRDAAWVSVKYERLQYFCFSCGRVDHEGKGCSVSLARKEGEGKENLFGSWFGTSGAKTVEDRVVVCKAEWCEVEHLELGDSDRSSRRSWSPGKQNFSDNGASGVDTSGGRSEPGEDNCQNHFRLSQEIFCQTFDTKGQGAQSFSSTPDSELTSGRHGLSKKDEYIDVDVLLDPIGEGQPTGLELLGQTFGAVVPDVSQAHQAIRITPQIKTHDYGKEGAKGDIGVGQRYIMEFPAESGPNLNGPLAPARLSPISSMALSLQQVHLKRPGSSSHRGRRTNHRTLKSLARRSLGAPPNASRLDSQVIGEIEFPNSWIRGSSDPNEVVLSSSDSQNAGGWMGPTAGAP